MPTVITDRLAALDYTEYTNNHVFVKGCNNGLFEYRQQGHHGHQDERTNGPSAKQLIGDALRERVESIDHESCEPGEEDTFFVADLGEVYRQNLRWKLNLPRVKPFYGETLRPSYVYCPSVSSRAGLLTPLPNSRQVQSGPEAPGAAVRPRHRF